LVKNINEDVEKTAETAQRETSRSLPRISTPDEVAERRRRTLFVGNLPLSCKKNQLKQIFKKYGRVEKIWFRNIAYTHPGRPKKISWIKKDFHPDLQTMTAFILFDSRENARKALVEHNTVLSGHHIRVDLAEPDKKVNPSLARLQSLCLWTFSASIAARAYASKSLTYLTNLSVYPML
jgi:nucleolar protein 12